MRPEVVLFGDSITQQSFRPNGWGAALADNFTRKVYGTPPVAVTIFFGANDAALLGATAERQHVPLDEYKENLRKIVTHIKNCSPNALILLITPPPVDPDGRREYARSLFGDKASTLADRTSLETGKYAEQCVNLAKELNLPSINLWTKMQETEDWQKKYLSDGLHLTPEGNALVSEEVIKVFEEAKISALPCDFPDHTEIDAEKPETAFVNLCGIRD